MKVDYFIFGILMMVGLGGLAQHKLKVADPRNKAIQKITKRVSPITGTLYFRDGFVQDPGQFMENYKLALGLTEHDELRLRLEYKDESGHPIYRYSQYHRGILVDGLDYILQTRDGKLTRLKGRGAQNLALDVNPFILEDVALEIALREVDADLYDFDNLNLIPRKRVEAGELYPRAEKVIVRDPKSLNEYPQYLLALRFEIAAIEPFGSWRVYVDAHTGEIIQRVSRFQHAKNATGTVYTAYNGGPHSFQIRERQFPNYDYILKDTTRGNIVVKDHINYSKWWDSVGHIDQGSSSWTRIEASLLWTAQQSFDYFKNAHGRHGMDGACEDLMIWANAPQTYYTVKEQGDKSAIFAASHEGAALDNMGHEFTHGVIRRSSHLGNAGETGALNESFADIFGTMVEREVVGDANYDWLIGGDFGAFRSMENPSSFGHPDTYGGPGWRNVNGCTPSENNNHCWVHQNAGVQNKWFQLLVEGGTHNGIAVAGLGENYARTIAYRNMTCEMCSNADYFDAREGAIDAAETLYGPCSNPVIQVTNAWAAVGVGPPANCTPPLSGYISGPLTLSFNQMGTWHAIVTNGVAPYSYRWSNGVTSSSMTTGFSTTGYHQLSVTITDAANQARTYNLTVYVQAGSCGVCEE